MLHKDKKLLITLILMLVLVAALILVAWLYAGRNQEYEDLIAAKDKSFNSMSKSYGELENENKTLYKKVEDLEKENEELKSLPSGGDYATYQQTLNDLADISLMIKAGNTDNAKTDLLKIDPIGFDPTALAFYESLCRELDIEI